MLPINIHKISHPPLNLCLHIPLSAPSKSMAIVSILKPSAIILPHDTIYLHSPIFMYFYVGFTLVSDFLAEDFLWPVAAEVLTPQTPRLCL